MLIRPHSAYASSFPSLLRAPRLVSHCDVLRQREGGYLVSETRSARAASFERLNHHLTLPPSLDDNLAEWASMLLWRVFSRWMLVSSAVKMVT